MKKINLLKTAGSFAENKDIAAEIRDKDILPSLALGGKIEIDFTGVTLTTQSFIHALISEPLRKKGEETLEVITFRGCNDAIRGIIETVVQYVLDTTDNEG
jgi:hypothetical protein